MKMTIGELREMIGEVLSEAKRAKKSAATKEDKLSRIANTQPYGYSYSESLDFMRPLGADSLYRHQGQAGWGPQTSAGIPMAVDDNIVLNKEIFRFYESKGYSAWEALNEASKPKKAIGPKTIWESGLHWYDFQNRGLGISRKK